jgi:predicted RecB family nuclease
MRFYENALLHAATDLNAFLGCAHATALNLRKLRDPQSLPDKAEDDESMILIQEAGHSHEAAYLANLKASGEVVEIGSEGDLAARARATVEAMRSGASVIYQATFLDAPWHGFADFLRRVDMPSSFGNFSYETIDTKLARTPSPKHVLQLGLYSDLIAGVQGARPHAMHLVLGDGKEASFRSVEFRHTLDAAKARYLDFIERGAPISRPEPCSACDLCGWRDVCGDQWEAEDHLSLVAGMQKGQILKLQAAGITTVAGLGALLPDTRIPMLAPTTFARLRAQAALQVARRTGEAVVEILSVEEGRGFARLPKPDPHDLFFDLEGDPLHPDGLEYLWGVHYRDGNAVAQFRFSWGHDRAGERAAFERIVDWFADHLAQHPGAHIYHYAAYEVTVLRRLSTAFASREEAVDRLLRAEKFVDLYAIARAAIRTSEPDLSLKTLEIFFAETRAEDVKRADQSIVHYHRWRETGEQALLDGILAYNKVDCENTEGLRNWLLTLRPDLPWWTKPGLPPALEKSEEAAEREARREALRQAVRRNASHLSDHGRELMAYLIDFHARAKKPEQWAIFDRCGRDPDELIDDGDCIGDISQSGPDWLRLDKRSVIARYRFPDQDSKLREGKDVLHAPTMENMGTIVHLDREAGILEVRRGAKIASPWPAGGSIIPTWPLDTRPLEAAVERVTAYLATSGNEVDRIKPELDMPVRQLDRYQAIVDIIERAGPRMLAWDGGKLVREGESLIDAATNRALALDSSALFIQGPPGTGKTYTSAHVILSLIAVGKRVGVSSNSHKAINNLLAQIEQVAAETGTTFSGAKKVSRNDPDSYLKGRLIADIESNDDVETGGYDLIGGTAWLFARSGMDQQLDYLFVDEAGQVSLGHLVAMGAAAKNIILVGDQMQLGQPIQGAHPGDSGLSILDYLLQGEATIAPDKGILLDTSWRMHPSIEGFISEAVYDGRLKAHPNCARQTLLLDASANSELRPYGIRMIAMDHKGCGQRSDEEAEIAANLIDSLLGQRFIDRKGMEGVIGLDNILVVAPYNLQVNALKARLPDGARVGTVDKFQGQEAEVVIVSLATSTPDDLPRHVDFFYSKNRLNVAISRARTLAVVLADPKLLELDAKTVEHLRLVNTLAWLTAHSGGKS